MEDEERKKKSSSSFRERQLNFLLDFKMKSNKSVRLHDTVYGSVTLENHFYILYIQTKELKHESVSRLFERDIQ